MTLVRVSPSDRTPWYIAVWSDTSVDGAHPAWSMICALTRCVNVSLPIDADTRASRYDASPPMIEACSDGSAVGRFKTMLTAPSIAPAPSARAAPPFTTSMRSMSVGRNGMLNVLCPVWTSLRRSPSIMMAVCSNVPPRMAMSLCTPSGPR